MLTARPPAIVTAADVKLVASVEFVKSINPEALIVVPLKLEEVIVLFERLSVPARVANVPVVGSVTFVEPVVVRIKSLDPLVCKLPPSVIVLFPLFTPVPPYVGLMTEPCQVPVAIVPRVVIEV